MIQEYKAVPRHRLSKKPLILLIKTSLPSPIFHYPHHSGGPEAKDYCAHAPKKVRICRFLKTPPSP